MHRRRRHMSLHTASARARFNVSALADPYGRPLGMPRRSHCSAAASGPSGRSDSSRHSSAAASCRLVASALGHCSRSRSAHHATHVTSMRLSASLFIAILYGYTVVGASDGRRGRACVRVRRASVRAGGGAAQAEPAHRHGLPCVPGLPDHVLSSRVRPHGRSTLEAGDQ